MPKINDKEANYNLSIQKQTQIFSGGESKAKRRERELKEAEEKARAEASEKKRKEEEEARRKKEWEKKNTPFAIVLQSTVRGYFGRLAFDKMKAMVGMIINL